MLNEWGIIFLNKVTDNIIECKSVVTSNMIASFTFGDTNSIWEVDKNSITVGSKVRYAYLVENGHWKMLLTGLFQATGKAAIRVISLSMIRPLRAE